MFTSTVTFVAVNCMVSTMAQGLTNRDPLPQPPPTHALHPVSETSFNLEPQNATSDHEPGENASTSALNGLRPITKQRQMFVLISAFLTVAVTIGFNQSYGVFQSYYTSDSQDMLPKSAKNQPALVAFVGTLGYGLTWAGSIAINPVCMNSIYPFLCATTSPRLFNEGEKINWEPCNKDLEVNGRPITS